MLLGIAFLVFGTFADWGVDRVMLLTGVWAAYVALWLIANVLISLKLGKTDIISMMWTARIPEKIVVRGQPQTVSFGFVIALKLVLILIFGCFAVFTTLLLQGYFTK